MSSSAIGILSASMLVTGMANTVSTKMLLSQFSYGEDGKVEKFSKPWFCAWNMLTAMLLVGVVDTVFRRVSRSGQQVMPLDARVPLVAGESENRTFTYAQKVALVAVPGCFDLLSSGFLWVGLLYTPASITNILRGSCIVFTAIFARIVFRREILGFQALGLVLCVTGIAIVGLVQHCSSEANSSGESRFTAFGMWMVIFSQIVQAVTLVAEEWLMKGVGLPGLQVIGWQGFWGCVAMLVVVYPLLYFLPGSDHGHLEDIIDTYYQIKSSSTVRVLTLLYIVSCSTCNAAGIAITGALSAVHRAILVAVTTLMIWAFGLWVHHFYDSASEYGEVWGQYSPLQLFGFCVLVLGQAIYGRLVRVPRFRCPPFVPVRTLVASPSAILAVPTRTEAA